MELSNLVGIVGGRGKTGSQFVKLFRGLGFEVIVSDLKTKLTNSELIKKADIVVFSVPLHLSEKIMTEEISSSKKGQIVLDVSSLKEKQVRALNKGKAEVLGMHPLFGPSRDDFKGLSMILCPGKCKKMLLMR